MNDTPSVAHDTRLPKPAAGPSNHAASRGAGWAALLVAALTLAVFSPVLRNGFVDSWDDDLAITQNPDYNPPRLANLTHYWVPPPHNQFYVPVIYTIWGLLAMAARSPAGAGLPAAFNPAVFHAASLLAHAAAAVVVFLILQHLVRRQWPTFVGALIFALHPIQVEAVAWASSLYTPLSALLGLLAIWQYLLFSDSREAGDKSSARFHYAMATIAFLLGMLTKPSVVTVPLIIAAIEIGLRGRDGLRRMLPLGTWVALSIPIVLVTRLAMPDAEVPSRELWQRVVVALDATAFYAWKLVWPARLCPDYGRTPPWLLGHPEIWVTCLAPIGAFLILRLFRLRLRWLNAIAGIFLAGLLPTLGLTPFNFQLYSTVSDRYAYLAMLAPAVLAAVVLAKFSRHQGESGAGKNWMPMFSGAAVILLGIFSYLVIVQSGNWRDSWKLFAYTLRANPQSTISSISFKYLLIPHADVPVHPCTLAPPELVVAGDLLLKQKHSDLAVAAYQAALARGLHDASTFDKLSIALFQTERFAEAAQVSRQAMAIDPTDAEAHLNLANTLDVQGDTAGAMEQFRLALRIDPASADALRGMARLKSITAPTAVPPNR